MIARYQIERCSVPKGKVCVHTGYQLKLDTKDKNWRSLFRFSLESGVERGKF